ncbi:MAG: TRAP transporter large permease subunit, partial [Gammaproteobacteria bacterium]
MMHAMALWLFITLCVLLMLGYPVALTLAGTALAFAGIGMLTGTFDPAFLSAFPNRAFGTISNTTLVAVPLFVFMGVMLEKSRVAEALLSSMGQLFGRLRGGLGLSVVIVGMLLAASTGIVGATIVTMGLMSLPTMLKRGYSPALATGTICATGTLGQIIPPSIALVLLGDILSSAYQQAQLNMGIFTPETVSVGDLFVGAIIPGLVLVILYAAYVLLISWLRPASAPAAAELPSLPWSRVALDLLPPLLLIAAVLGSILAGIATPTEAAGVGAAGALLLAAAKRELSLASLRQTMQQTVEVTAMVFLILLGAALFSLVFRGFGGEAMIQHLFDALPGGKWAAIALVMLVIFLLG